MNSLINYDSELNHVKFDFSFIGVSNYLNFFFNLRKKVYQNHPSIIHAHYSLAGMVALAAKSKSKVVVSLMGSDIYQKGLVFKIARWYVLKKADHIIVKSDSLLNNLPTSQNISVIPNGVNLENFKPTDKNLAKSQISWDQNKIHILFGAGRGRYEKNYKLAEDALRQITDKKSIEIHILDNINPQEVPVYMNAADIVLLTSRWEGSSNVTKEAMACNTIVVSTDVGDARELFDGLDGYYITSHSPEDISLKIVKAIKFLNKGKKTKGRKRIIERGLDEESIAKRIINIYQSLLFTAFRVSDEKPTAFHPKKGKTQLYIWFFIIYFITLLLLYIIPLKEGISLNNYNYSSFRLDHIIHVLVFIPTSFVIAPIFLRQTQFRVIKIIALSFVLGALFETIHLLVPYRAFTVADLLSNLIGVAIGSLLFLFFKNKFS